MRWERGFGVSNFNRGLRLGAGLVTLGFGIYRMSRGRRDWATAASITTGASMVLADTEMGRGRMGNMMGTVASVARMATRVLT